MHGSLPTSLRPEALKWLKYAGDDKSRKFNSPDGAPGRVKWHPGWRTHQLLGLTLATMHLAALEVSEARPMRRMLGRCMYTYLIMYTYSNVHGLTDSCSREHGLID